MRRARDREKHCPTKKATWDSATAATFAAGVLGKKHGVKFYPYRCPTCGEWHLTKNPDPQRDGAQNKRTA